jgi:hypothetical protein
MQKKERKNKKSNNLTSNLLQKETHTHTHTHKTHIDRGEERKGQTKKNRDLESCGVVTQIEKAKRIVANPRETMKEILFYFLVLHYKKKRFYLPVQKKKKKKNKNKKTCCNSLPLAATGAPKATR